MRRNARIKHSEEKSLSDKIILYSGIGVAILTVIVIGLLLYSKSLSDDVKNSTMSLEEMANIASNNQNINTESASTEMGKSVEEAEKELNTENEVNVTEKKLNENLNNTQTNNTSSNLNTSSKANNTNTTTQTAQANQTNQAAVTQNATNKKEESKELVFEKPVDGEISKEYSKDNLIYSATLDEWTTHMGIDIKAEKTTVVKAAEDGTVKTIKNDPRYGLTIVIEHENGFQTIYSNLLTSEFVVEGEKVKKGQSIGTVGNTAVFEIADESHLHFEIWKDSLAVDPSIYIK